MIYGKVDENEFYLQEYLMIESGHFKELTQKLKSNSDNKDLQSEINKDEN